MKKHLVTIAFVLGAIVALSVLLYPIVADAVNKKNQVKVVSSYIENVEALGERKTEEILEAAAKYNEWLRTQASRFNFSQADMDNYLGQLDTGRSVMGVLEIRKIDVKLPIYHGTDEGVLQVGLGHMESTSLPVGGAGSHAFITGHRGLPSSKLLSNLDRMTEGDVFTLRILSDILTYQVDEIKTVLPDAAGTIEIDPEQDYVTLVTCTPYGVNTHRLLVRGRRIANAAAAELMLPSALRMNKLLMLPVFLSPVLLALLLYAAVKCIKISRGGKAKWPNDLRARSVRSYAR